MKKFIFATLSTLGVIATTSVSAQNFTSYFIDSAIESKNHNAAFAPDRGYFNIPIVGGISLSTNGNLSLGQLLYPMDGSLVPIFDTRVPADTALAPLNAVNSFGVENRLTILGFGKYRKDRKSFWSFDLSMRTSSNFSMPYELFEFVKALPETTSIKDVNVYVESYLEAAFGYSKQIDDRLRVGGRVKFLAGLANATLQIDQLDVSLLSDEWMATAQGHIDVNMKGVTLDSEDGIFELGGIDPDISGVAGYGAAIDFGATYDLTEDLELSLSANDVGFILWGKEGNTRGSLLDQFVFSGVNIDVDGEQTSNQSEIDLDELKFEEESSKSSMKWLQANFNAGAEYKLWDDRVGVGAIYSARLWRTNTLHSLTAAVTFTPIEWFTLATSYAVTNNSANAVGFAANLATGFMNLYVATDILTSRKSAQFIPIDQSMMNISFGLAVPIGPKGKI